MGVVPPFWGRFCFAAGSEGRAKAERRHTGPTAGLPLAMIRKKVPAVFGEQAGTFLEVRLCEWRLRALLFSLG